MPRYQIKSRPQGVQVRVTEAAGNEERLIGALQACQEGRCSCPTPEYEKLASMQVRSAAGTVEIDLETEAGAELDPDAVRRCLDFTMDRLQSPGPRSGPSAV